MLLSIGQFVSAVSLVLLSCLLVGFCQFLLHRSFLALRLSHVLLLTQFILLQLLRSALPQVHLQLRYARAELALPLLLLREAHYGIFLTALGGALQTLVFGRESLYLLGGEQ